MEVEQPRYFFVAFSDLKQVKFKKLRQVSDKVFVFYTETDEQVPLKLARKLQSMGKNLRWLEMEACEPEDFAGLLGFYLGQFHQKLDKRIEFALLSDNEDLDPLVNLVNNSGRSCIRVRVGNDEAGAVETHPIVEEPLQLEKREGAPRYYTTVERSFSHPVAASPVMGFYETEKGIERSADDIVNRLVRSGNRPASILSLKDYIRLNNKHVRSEADVEKVIGVLREKQEIELQDDEVIYHF